MKEEFEKLESALKRDLEGLFSHPISKRYKTTETSELEEELNIIESTYETISRIEVSLDDYYEDIRRELARRENKNAV